MYLLRSSTSSDDDFSYIYIDKSIAIDILKLLPLIGNTFIHRW